MYRQRAELTLVLGGTGDREGVCGHRSLNLRCVEVDDCSVVLDHVNLLDSGNIGNRHLLKVALELLVIACGSLVDDLLLSASGSLQLGLYIDCHHKSRRNQPFHRYGLAPPLVEAS